MGQRVGAHRGTRRRSQLRRAWQRAAACKIAAHADQSAAARTADVQSGPVQRDLLPSDSDLPAGPDHGAHNGCHNHIAARWVGPCGDAACDPDLTASAAAQNDGAAAHGHRRCLGHAGQVDGVAHGVTRGGGFHLDPATLGRHSARVFNQGLAFGAFGRGRHRDLQKAIARHIERHTLARREPDAAHRHTDPARVADMPAQQGCIAPAPDLDCTAIHDGARLPIATIAVGAALEILIGDIKGRRDKAAARLHHAVRADKNTIGIDDMNLPVGGDPSVNIGAGIARHTVQDCRIGIGLVKPQGLARANVKAVPVHNRRVCALRDRHPARARRTNLHTARGHLTT